MLQKWIEPRSTLSPERKTFSNAALKAMIIPLLIEQLLQVVVGLVDTLMVSYAGESVVSGVSLVTMIHTIFIFMFTAIASGGAVIVSQYLGKKDHRNSNLAASQLFLISGVFSAACTVLMLVGGNAILRLLYGSVTGDVMAACRTYLRIVTLSFPATALYNAGAAVYRSMGKTRTTMKISIAMNLLNAIGNAIGIFVLHAGAAGVAWPTTISWYFAAVIMTALCFRRKNDISLEAGLMTRFNGAMDKRILGVAVPNSVENGLFQLAKVVLGSVISTFGTVHIAANGIGQTFWSVAALIGTAMGPIFITVIGQCVGAGDKEAADYYLQKLTRITFLLAFVWNAVVMAVTPLMLPLYSIAPETAHLVLIIVAIHNFFSGTVQPFAMPMSTGLRAAGDVKFTMQAALFCTLVIRVAFSFILGVWMNMGVVGIAWAMVLDWTVKAALILMRYRSGKWKQFRLI